MQRYRSPILAILTLCLAAMTVLVWAQTASAHRPQQLSNESRSAPALGPTTQQSADDKGPTTGTAQDPYGPVSASGEPTSKVEQPTIPPTSKAQPEVISAGTYAFSSAAAVALENMSTGTTQILAGNGDDTNSVLANIGFEFWFDGVRYTQFSVNNNGLMRLGPTVITGLSFTNDLANAANAPQLAPYWDDLWGGYNGKVHYKVIGSAPNRKLVVEWLNEQIPRVAGNIIGAGTFQAWIFETTGVVEFVYGNGIVTNAVNAGYSVGIGSSATQFASVTTAGPTVAYGTANNTQTNAIASGTAYLFTPNVPAAPTGLNFTGVTQTAMTVNWTDNATNEVGYVVYVSTDGITYTFVTQLAAGSTSYAASGLLASSTYFWRIYAVSEGALSTVLAGSQAPLAPTAVSSTGAGGLWSSTTTWVGGVLPTASDSVTIAAGATVTIDTAAVAYSVTVNSTGLLTWDSAVARTLTTGGPVTVNAGANFDGPATGAVTAHVLSIGGNLTNNGQMDFSTNGDTAGANITFTGAANSTVSGSGGGMDVRGITINKGTSSASVLEWMPTVFTVQGVTTDVAGFLTLTNGTFKISGSYAMTNRVFTTPTYIIPATAGIWLNNPNFTVAATASAAATSNNGLFRVSQGTYNIGIGAGDQMLNGAGAVFIIEGGTVNVSGAFDPQNAVTYTQSAGTVNVGIVGNNVSAFGTFELFSTATIFTMSGGTINIINPSTGATKVDYRVNSPLATTSITGGQVIIGATGAPAASIYTVSGAMPNTTINATMTMRVNNATVSMRGSTVTNNGTIDFTGANARYDFGSQTGAMSYGGSGIFGTLVTPFAGVGVSANSLFLTTLNAPIIVNRVNLFLGGFINSNQITLGNAGASTTVIQIGSAGLTTAAASFDVSPVHNQGTGGEILLYNFETQIRTTGFEINPTRNVTSMSRDNASFPVNISGGNITVTSAAAALTLTNGRFVTGANVLYLSSGTATVNRTNGYIEGNFRKNFTAVASKLFEVGTANGYSPVTVNVTAGTFPADVTVKATQTAMPSIPSPSLALQRYWTLTATGLTADLTFNYLDPTDIPGTATEANFVIFKYDGALTQPGGTVNTGTNSANITGVTGITADWTLAEPAGAFTPTATNTVVASSTPTRTNTATQTSTATNTVGATNTPTVTATPTCGGTASWVSGPVLSPGRALFQGGVAGDGNFYVAGGQATGAGTPVANVDRFVTSSSTWNVLAPLPVAAGQVAVGAAGNKVYVAGGFLGGTAITSTLRIYDIPSNTWSFGASMPGSVEAAAGAVLAGKFYVVGGDDFNNAVATNYIYDIAGNTWSTGAPLPAVRTNVVGTAVGGLVYVFGGVDAAFAAVDTLYSYNPGTNSWTTLAPAGTGTKGNYGGISPYTVGKLLATDGATTAFAPSVTTHIYDIAGNTWSAGPNLLLAHAGHAQGLLPDGRTIIAGGLTTGGATTTDVELLTIAPCGTVTVTPTAPAGTPTVTTTRTATVTTTRTVTVTPTIVSGTATGTATVGPTATCVPSAGGWTAGAPLSAGPDVRGTGTYFSTNNRFYALGGRSSDVAGSDYLNPHEYNPVANTWITKTATFTSSLVNNMVSGVLTVGGTPMIVAVGGSAAGGTVATGDVRLYNPVADTLTLMGTDPWPEGTISNTLPGGVAVVSNKMYVLGGFNLTGTRNVVDTIWELDPARPAGSRWQLKSTHLPIAMGYIPAGAIGGMIYSGGGATWDGTNLIDTTNAYRYDPVANTISTIAALPTATSNTRAAVFNGKLWVIGGVFLAPSPLVQIYDPTGNTWASGPPLTTGRRNVTLDTDGTRIFVLGGYTGAAPGTPLGTLEIYTAPVACGTATVTPTTGVGTPTATRTTGPTNTATVPVTTPATATVTRTTPPQPTSTATATTAPTTCPVQFQDVPNGSTFYEFIRCLACRGIVNGYPCGGPGEPCPGSFFRPNNNVTRGQVSKIVSESAGFNNAIPSTQWTFQDVPPSGTFWIWIERLSGRGIIGGYPCGGALEPCVAPGNRPYFRPNNDVTRGQLSKIVSGAAGWTETPTGQTFQDVAPGSTFYVFVERVASRGIVTGYPCGGAGEPCVAPGNKPYFRPNNNATRGQMSKIAASAFFPGCSTPARNNSNN